eukprot:COSAG02_NODE_9825_length_2099_cov_8.286000_2_plen_115_part_00
MLADRLGCSLQETVFFGDGGNDVEALGVCGIGVAVANGTDHAKMAADYTSRYRNTEDAVARELSRLALDKEFGQAVQMHLDLSPPQADRHVRMKCGGMAPGDTKPTDSPLEHKL